MKLITPKQAAERACVSLSLIYGVLQAGKLPALRVGFRGRGKWLIPEPDFESWLANCKAGEVVPLEDGDRKYL